MTGILKSLFGGSETKQSSQSTSTPINFTSPDLQGLSGDLASQLRQLLTGYSNQVYGAGNPVANATPTPQAPVTAQEQSLLDSIPGQIGANTDRAKYFSDVLTGKYLPGGENSNPFLQSAIQAAQRTTLEGLTETLERSLPGRFTSAGQLIQPQGSSAFDRAAGIATRGVANAVGDIATNMSNTNFQNERNQQTQVAGLDQGEVDATIKGLQASALPRLIQQNGLDQGLALFQQQTDKLLELLKTIGAVQAPTLANQSQSTAQGTSSTEKGIIPGLFPNGLGGSGGPK